MQSLRYAAIVFAVACSDRPSPDRAPAPSGSAPTPTPTTADAAPPDAVAAAPGPDARVLDEKAIRARHALRAEPRGEAVELADGAGHVKLALPAAPAIDGRIVDQENLLAFHAQALLNGKAPIDAEVTLVSILDGDVPPAMVQQLAQVPEQLATATGGKVTVNETTTLAGKAARRFELVTPDKRRLFGWYAAVGAARVLQINCIGADLDGIRRMCEAIPKSVVLGKEPDKLAP